MRNQSQGEERIGRTEQQGQDRDREPLRVMPVDRGEAEIVIAPRTAPTWREAAMNEGSESSLTSIAPVTTLGAILGDVCVIQLN